MKRVVYIIFGLITALSLSGQSFYHNTQQFGLKSTLLGGSVIAGNEDLSMVYYNPAALRYADEKVFDLSLIIPSLSADNFGNFFDEQRGLSHQTYSLEPSLFTYKTNISGDFDIVLTLIQKEVWDKRIEYSRDVLLGQSINRETFRYNFKGNERLYGFGSNFNITDNICIGLSHFWRDFDTQYSYAISDEILSSSNQQESIFSESLDLDYSVTFSMLTKLGLAMHYGKHKYGFVITTPDYAPFQNGGSVESINARLEENDVFEISNTFEFDLNPTIKDSWEFNLGYALTLADSSAISASVSYHTGIEDYSIFSVQKSPSENIDLISSESAVFNFSVGYTTQLNKSTSLLCSFRTNHTSNENKPSTAQRNRIYLIDSNKHHLAAGINVVGEKSAFIIGLDFGFSQANTQDLFQNFPNIELFENNESAFKNQELTLLVTYEFLLNSFTKNISKIIKKEN